MKDKLLHLGVCFLATIGMSSILYAFGVTSALAGVTFSIGLGLGKEYGDSRAMGNRWDWMDILADILGIVIAIISLYVIHRIL